MEAIEKKREGKYWGGRGGGMGGSRRAIAPRAKAFFFSLSLFWLFGILVPKKKKWTKKI